MPGSKYSRKRTRYRRKTYRRKRYGSKTYRKRRSYSTTVRTGIGMVLPPRLITKLKGIAFNVVSDLDPADFDSYTYRLNSIYNYDAQDVNNRPRGYNEIAAFYQRYRVYKVTWMIQCPAVNDRLMIVVLPVNNPITAITNLQDAVEYPRAIYRQLGYAGNNPVTIRGGIYLPKLTGAPPSTYKADDRYSAAINGNPAEVMDLLVGIYNSSGSANLGVTFTVQLIYHVELFDPLALPSSDVSVAALATFEPYVTGKYLHNKAKQIDPRPPGLEGPAGKII